MNLCEMETDLDLGQIVVLIFSFMSVYPLSTRLLFDINE